MIIKKNDTYCYIRKSTDKQIYDRQINILKEKGYINGINCIYILETYTGKTTKRPELDKLLETIKENDTIVVESLSRLSRGGLLKTLEIINDLVIDKTVNLIILKEGLNLKAGKEMDYITKFLINIFSILAEFERDLLSDRTKEGLQAQAKKGVKLGRPTNKTIKDFINTLKYNSIGYSVNNSIKLTNYPKSSYIKNLSYYRKKFNINDKKLLLKELEKIKL